MIKNRERQQETAASFLMLTAEVARDLLSYDSATGVLRWKKRLSNRCKYDEAGVINACGYRVVGIKGKRDYVHRIVWLIMTGEWPGQRVDHIDGNKANNSWSNLRLASHAQNLANAKLNARNTSGFKGVHYNKRIDRFCAHGAVNGKKVHLGSYDTALEAHEAYLRHASARYGAEFTRSQ